jgi:hypothetical protein
MRAGGYQVRRPPAHAGRLRSWERFTIMLVFLLVAAGIAVIMVVTASPPSTSAPAHRHGTERPQQPPGPAGPRRR